MADNFDRDEADDLVRFFRSKNIMTSSDISYYIRTHNMKNRWPHITGHITMADDSDVWDFDGGISPSCYRYICRELNIDDNGSDASVQGFTPYANSRYHGYSGRQSSSSLEEKLRTYRKNKADEEGVPAYCIFNNEVLDAIVETRPTTKWELLDIRGFGPAKYEKYGADIIRIVKRN